MSEWKNGLPPVGEHCEWRPVRPYTGVWEEVKYHGLTESGEAIIEHDSGNANSVSVYGSDFRPLKSEVERKRDRDILEMIADSSFYRYTEHRDCTIEHYQNSITKETAERLYECGYRKVNPLTDEQIYRVLYSTCNNFGRCQNETHAWREGAKWARSKILGDQS